MIGEISFKHELALIKTNVFVTIRFNNTNRNTIEQFNTPFAQTRNDTNR
jgi:hypothetical protein